MSVDNNSYRLGQGSAIAATAAIAARKGRGPGLRWFFWLPALLAAVIVAVMLAALVLVSARSLQRLTPVQDHLKHIERLHAIGLHMEELVDARSQQDLPISQADLKRLLLEVRSVEEAAPDTYPETLAQLSILKHLLASSKQPPREILLQATTRLRQIENRERMLHKDLVDIVARDSQLELKLALLLLLSLPLIIFVSFYLLKSRIERPLDDLNRLLRRLSKRDYRPVNEIQVEESAGLIQPVFRSYNALVNRLAQLEAEHRALQTSLEEDVKLATSALLEQAGDLARAEKLAAVGELSAAMAHEIRNPLAGIQLACTKLGRQLPPAQQQKIEMVVSELKRVNSMLGERLYEARHAPEPTVDVDVGDLVASLVTLLNYQVHENIRLQIDVVPGLICPVPESGLRQSLLNLVMNAAKVIGDEEGVITLFARRVEDRLEIGVSDNGPGFPRQMIDHGVQPFRTGRVDGTGLGLAIVQRFTRSLFGELRLENLEQGGARVTLVLPCKTTSRLNPESESPSQGRGVAHG